MLAEVLAQDSSSPPDKRSSPPLNAGPYSSFKSTSKILPNQNSRASKKPCKYIRAKQICPFGGRCHFSHDTPRADITSPLTPDQDTDTHSTTPTVRHWRNKPHPPSGPRSRPSPDASDAFLHQDQHRRYHPSRNRQKHSYSKLTPPDLKQLDLTSSGPKPASSECKHTQIAHSESKEARSNPRQLNPPCSDLKQPSTDPKKSKQGPSELSLGSFLTPSFNRPPVQRPKSKKVTKSSTSELREVELEQFVMRFPDSVLLEKGKEKTVYSFSYQPADPEWDFSFKLLTFEVTFPGDYPLKPLSVRVLKYEVISDQVLKHINSCLDQHLMSDAVETGTLMFRPFLHWLDRNLASILRDGLSKVFLEEEPQEVDDEASDTLSEVSADSMSDSEENIAESSVAVSIPVKAGTEIRLVGVSLSQTVATVTFSTPKLVVICGRCKQQEEIRAKPESGVGGNCSRCQTVFTVVYHPTLVHASSFTIGYLDLNGCSPTDLVLLDCAMRLVCLECGYDNETKTMMFGQPKDFWCRKCHSKLSISAEQCKYIKHQPTTVQVSDEVIATQVKTTRSKEPVFKLGLPLPDYGVCLHYKKSHRWFRFPCCGRAYPCDVCHDASESHVMERAKRMICGYCSLEQVYSASKPCSGCGSDISSMKHTSFWQGGKGCRSKTKMSRHDKHKYSDSSQKTSSHKSKRVGKQEKAS